MYNNILRANYIFIKGLLLVFAILLCNISFSQTKRKNIVPNPGFEYRKSRSALLKNAIPWQNEGTVDYYVRPDRKDTSIFKGPHSGKCYVGMRFQPNYKEYMYVKLTETLVRGNTYDFRMFVKLLDRSTVTVKQLGVYFSDDAFEIGMNFDQNGVIDSSFSEGIKATKGWVPIQGEYLARGGENYIIIGNFKTKMKDDFVRQKKWDIFEVREAYYYIDDISVLRPETIISPEMFIVDDVPNTFVKGQIVPLGKVHFEANTAKLTRKSAWALDDLINKLNNYPFMEIKINAHTDNLGKPTANLKLSKARAKTINDYLVERSVINPMFYEGLGAEKPLVPNDSQENRAKNNRVEIEIIKLQN